MLCTHQGSKNIVVVLSHHTHGQGLQEETNRQKNTISNMIFLLRMQHKWLKSLN